MVIANTFLQEHRRRLYTWTSPDSQYRNQTDYILCSQRWRSSTQSAKTKLGVDCSSDREPLIAKFRFIYFFPFIFLSWRLITLQYCSVFCHTLTWISHGFTCVSHPEPLPLPPCQSQPSGSSQCTSPKHLSHASNLDWWSVSHLIIYTFWCCSLRSSHPRLLPQNPKVCSIHLCLLFCLAYRVILTIFLNSIYMC